MGISLVGCKPDTCKKVNCAHSGVCMDGTCLCEVGYEGTQCEITARDKFVRDGTYQVNEEGTLTPYSNYTVSIVNGDRINEVKIKQFRNGILGTGEVIATVSNDTMSIAPQVVSGYRIEGTGIIYRNTTSEQYYYQNATVKLYYKVTNLLTNAVDEYGSNGSQPSDWNKN